MSKLKLMYDVITTMKEKEVISGTFQASGKKDQIKILAFTNEFEKNLLNGETRAKMSTEMDYDGKKVKHESQTEFNMQSCAGHRHNGFWKHLHHHHHIHNNPCHNQEDVRCGGIKGKLTKLAFVLNIFNQIKVEEKEDKSVILSLNLNDIPDDIKKVFQERISQRKISEHHNHQCFMKEYCNLKDPRIEFNIWITKTKEVEKIVVTIDGTQIDELNNIHEMNLSAELLMA